MAAGGRAEPLRGLRRDLGMKGLTTMKRPRHTPEQVVRKLRERERLLNEGTELTEVLRHLEVSGTVGATSTAA